jgi:hypothetical protein
MSAAKRQTEKLTDAERHKRFVDMAKEVEVSEDPKDFEKAFDKVARTKISPTDPKTSRRK